MKVAPFPFGLNVGTDIVHIPRILRLVTRSSTAPNSYLNRFIRRILSEQEQAVFISKFPQYQSHYARSAAAPSSIPAPPDSRDMARWLAGRFAAKEAARKAAPGGAASVSWKEAIVINEAGGNGKPEVVYLKKGDEVGQAGKLSISHDGEYVVATVIAAIPNS
ncbi:predicted protein [Uncinocarpus reesii 1704]|uniref:4'-phosphopantetheinyl transferase domain-containing protein n=1 Tax=Uncinocarpus reesii (strain UAMH 1704) TaxID=336963 RepID=C4JH86_UNCRE|nr:uncharacterized protein UREG_02659 [Uncinocarpus reesii 1704]EEP77810.1 predicted protein [Uncinocarpus reesii 1704]